MTDGEAGSEAGADVELDVAGSEGRAGAVLSAYRAAAARGRGPGVLVLGDPGGVSGLVRDAADRLARAGFVALAPRFASAGGGPEIEAGLSALLADHVVDGPRLGVLGFDRGGVLALRLAREQRRVGAAVDFYGLPEPEEVEALAGLDVPCLLVFGEGDERMDVDGLAALTARMPAARLRREPDAGRGFMDARAPERYAAKAAASGWDRALAFLGAAL